MARANLSPERLVAAGAQLADTAGLEQLSLSALARQFGVQPASLYSHLASRDELIAGVHRFALGELAQRVSGAVAGRAGRDALIGLADAHRDYAQERPGAWEALLRPASPETARSAEAAQLSTLTLAVLRGYGIEDDSLVDAARFVGATINGFLSLSRSESFAHRSDDVARSWLAALDALDRALTSWPRKDTPA